MCGVCVLAMCPSGVRAEELRTWTDSSGKHKREAAFEKLEGDVVHLRTKEGKQSRVPLEKLSQADQSYARNAASAVVTADPFEESVPQPNESDPLVTDVALANEVEPEDPNLRVVIAEGVGASVEKAKKDAYREAVRQVVGAYVDSSQLLKNDTLIEDRIITLSSAYVEKASPPITKVTEDGVIRVKVRAWVRLTKVLETLKESHVHLKVDNTSFAAELHTKADQVEGEEALMARVFASYPANSFKASLAGKPEIKKASATEAVIRIGLKIEPDLQQYLVVSQKIEAALGTTGRTNGEFSVDGKKFPASMAGNQPVDYWFRNGAIFSQQAGLISVLPADDCPRLELEKRDDGRCGATDIPQLFHFWPADEDRSGGFTGINAIARTKWEKLRPGYDTHVILLTLIKANATSQRTKWKWYLLEKDEARQWFAPACKKMKCTLSFVDGAQDELLEDQFSFSHLGWQVLDVGSSRQYIYVCAPYFVGDYGAWYAPSFTYMRQIEAEMSELEGLASVKCSLVNSDAPDEVRGVTD
jgi:hypothetical protein